MFDYIFKDAPTDTYVELTKLPNDRQYLAASQLPSVFDEPPIDLFFGPALRKTAGASKEDCYGSRTLWCDIDNPQLPRATLAPSIVLFSGGGYHFYWLLDTYSTAIEDIEQANRILAEDLKGVGGDIGCWNINRLLRVPGTTNSKYGTLTEIRQVRNLRYKLQDFQVLQKLHSKLRHKIRTGETRGYAGDKSRRDWAIITGLVAAGADDRLIELIFRTQACGNKYKDPETPKTYLSHTIAAIREAEVESPTRVKGYGDIEATEDGYWVERSRGRQRLSTFILMPKLLLQGQPDDSDPESKRVEDAIICDVHANGHVWPDVTFTRSSFNDRRALDKCLTIAGWSFLGRDDDVRALLPYLLKQLQAEGLPRARATGTLGRHGQLFVATRQTISVDTLYEGRDAPLLYLGVGRDAPPLQLSQGDVPSLDLLPYLNEAAVLWPTLGWFMATPYKPALKQLGFRFPILNVFGTRGSGKTTLIKLMQRMLGYAEPTTYDCTTTKFVALALLGATNAVPIAFSEFRYSAGQAADRFLRLVLLSYDTGRDARGNPNQTLTEYPLVAPFSVDGEDIIADAAAKERIVAVVMHPEVVREQTPAWLAYKQFEQQSLPTLNNFALPYLQYTLGADIQTMYDLAHKLVSAAFTEALPDRVRNNMTVAAFGMVSFCDFMDWPLPDMKVALRISLESVWSSALGRSGALVDEFVEALVNEVHSGNQSYAQFFNVVKGSGTQVWFQLATAWKWWSRIRHSSGQGVLEKDAIRNQLQERTLKNGTHEPGQYILPGDNVSDVWCYGIDLGKAKEAGLDVPGLIQKGHTLKIRLPDPTTKGT